MFASKKILFAGICTVLLTSGLAQAQFSGQGGYGNGQNGVNMNAPLTHDALFAHLKTVNANVKKVQKEKSINYEMDMNVNGHMVPVDVIVMGNWVHIVSTVRVFGSVSQVPADMPLKLLQAHQKTSPTHFSLLTLNDGRCTVRASLRMEMTSSLANFTAELRYFLGDLNSTASIWSAQGYNGYQTNNSPAPYQPSPAPSNGIVFQGNPQAAPQQPILPPSYINSNGQPTQPVR